jgi:hypothetical protein
MMWEADVYHGHEEEGLGGFSWSTEYQKVLFAASACAKPIASNFLPGIWRMRLIFVLILFGGFAPTWHLGIVYSEM